ncbi:MAG: hypothetical protein ABSE49_27505 [Polyangiaceae bacterium]|jgi:DNA-binding XRE family transcriptional regulator
MVLRLRDGRRFHRRQLLQMVQNELLVTQSGLGAKIGVSKRTIIRWGNRESTPAPFQVERMADLVRANGNEDLADSLFEEAGLPIPAPPVVPAEPTVSPSGTTAPSAPPGPSPPALVDAVVCAAADAADLTPRTTRLALRAALLRATELGVPLDALADALAPTVPRVS